MKKIFLIMITLFLIGCGSKKPKDFYNEVYVPEINMFDYGYNLAIRDEKNKLTFFMISYLDPITKNVYPIFLVSKTHNKGELGLTFTIDDDSSKLTGLRNYKSLELKKYDIENNPRFKALVNVGIVVNKKRNKKDFTQTFKEPTKEQVEIYLKKEENKHMSINPSKISEILLSEGFRKVIKLPYITYTKKYTGNIEVRVDIYYKDGPVKLKLTSHNFNSKTSYSITKRNFNYLLNLINPTIRSKELKDKTESIINFAKKNPINTKKSVLYTKYNTFSDETDYYKIYATKNRLQIQLDIELK